jgi:ubiquinone/menaquinone biosynthesis C-methylase UbiE
VDKLNLGCGTDIRSGYINLDSAALPGVDVVHDLDNLPLPFADAQFDEVLCMDVLEHIELIPVLRELHRVTAPGGRVHIRSPHFTSRNFYVDPTHRKAFSIDTLRFFVRNGGTEREYYFDFAFSAEARAVITFMEKPSQPWGKLISRLVNRSPRHQRYYESTGLSRLFPAFNVETTLIR